MGRHSSMQSQAVYIIQCTRIAFKEIPNLSSKQIPLFSAKRSIQKALVFNKLFQCHAEMNKTVCKQRVPVSLKQKGVKQIQVTAVCAGTAFKGQTHTSDGSQISANFQGVHSDCHATKKNKDTQNMKHN